MKSYRRYQNLIVAFFCFSVVVGIAGTFTPQREVFPIFSWFLFSLVPGKSVGYDLIINEVGGQAVNPPIPYRQASQYFAMGHSVVIYRAIQELGKAEKQQDQEAILTLRASIENNFFIKPVQYDLVKVTFDNPLQRWESGEKPLKTQLVRSFVSLNPSK